MSRRVVRLFAPGALAVVLLVACSGHKADSPALQHAKTACAHWAKLNVGINDATQRKQESEAYQREATAAAAADAKYKPLQAAAENWTFVEQSPPTVDTIDALRSAIDQSRKECAGVPTK